MDGRRCSIAVSLLLALAAAAPAWGQQTASERADLARYQKYAGAPVDRVHYFQITGFQYLAPDTVALWFGVNKMYLLTVQTPCTGLAYANGIGLTARNKSLYSGMDFVTFDDRRCLVTRITPVDELQMKKDRAAAASGSSG